MDAAAGARSDRSPIAILSYHQTTKVPPRGTPVRTLVLPPWRFRLQLWLLKTMGWQGLSMRDLEPYLRGEKTGKVFGITLDDGYVNNFQEALPIIRSMGFTATAFIVSAQTGGSNVWDHAQGVPPAPLMDVGQMKAWIDAGMEIGAHTRNHVDLRTCDDDRARDEIAGSKADLEQWLGVEVRSFSYPYGEHTAAHVEMVRQAGYTTATTIISSRARLDDDMMRLPRISVHLNDSIPQLLAQVTTDFEDWRMQRPGRRGSPNARPQVAAQPQSDAAATGIGSGVPAP
ncbi:MAG TPA: polysaccharide deacetylase family protein [Ramlibacter sp.]|uniref:polysaccharide deacetylase family protein n=1 Tax=Ramlibacter sp. TaxID=1917967 RepID=UPI002D387AEB|nr:polysaccharide deacetylase family protein [Ramlibacter sp.]HZY17561.1 polysaccharide deacetylase family protein [Ramlibacter sp.]